MTKVLMAKRTLLDLDYNHEDITEELEKHLLDWTFTDNLSGEIDDLNIQLEDTDALWIGKWFPTEGSLLEPTLIRSYWADKQIKTKLGKFEIDEISGAQSVITISALATSEATSLRGEAKCKAWEKATLKKVIGDVASANGLKLVWESSENPKKDRYEQENETDLKFVYRLCKDEGLCLKLSSNTIVVLDEEDYEKQPTVEDIRRKSKGTDVIKVISYTFKNTLTDMYRACRVTNHDATKKKTISATFTAPKAPKVGRTLVVKEDVKTVAEAQSLAKKKLREKNKNAKTINLEVISSMHIDAGMTFNILDFGVLNGKYIATRVVYKPFSVSVETRRCLEGY